jgi:hypothetical protein
MSKPEPVLTWKTRRDLLESRKKPQPGDLSRAGRELLSAGRRAEAWEFFNRAGDRKAIEGLRDFAVVDGDFFMYSLAAGSLGDDKNEAAVRMLSENARKKGFIAYAERALASLEPPKRAGGTEALAVKDLAAEGEGSVAISSADAPPDLRKRDGPSGASSD